MKLAVQEDLQPLIGSRTRHLEWVDNARLHHIAVLPGSSVVTEIDIVLFENLSCKTFADFQIRQRFVHESLHQNP